MVFGWFDAKAAEASGTELAKTFMGRVPLDGGWKPVLFAVAGTCALNVSRSSGQTSSRTR